MKKHILISSSVAALLLIFGTLLPLLSGCDKAPDNTPCDPPTNVQVTGIGPNTATLTWSAPPNTTVEISVSPDPVPGGPFTTSDTTFTLTGLSPDTDYKVTLRTICGDGTYSDPVVVAFKTTNIIIVDIVVQREAPIMEGLALCSSGGTFPDKLADMSEIPWESNIIPEMLKLEGANAIVYILKHQTTSGGIKYSCFNNGITFCSDATNNAPTSMQTVAGGVRLSGPGFSIELTDAQAKMNPSSGGPVVYSMYR